MANNRRKRAETKDSVEELYDFVMGEDGDSDEEKDKNDYTDWVCGPNKTFFPYTEEKKIKELQPGLYKIEFSQKEGYFVTKQSIYTDELLTLPIKEVDSILHDIKNFWSREEKFKEYNLIYKRGILLYGPPGCGKSCCIQRIIKHLIEEKNGLVFSVSNHYDLERYIDFMPNILRVIEPNRPIVTILEDLDGLVAHHETETMVLNVLDGMRQSEKIVYVATTNYPEKLKERILNRPSRFDKRYKIGYPTPAVREFYFKNKLKKEDLKKVDMKAWVKKSDGFSLAHLREMITSIIILGNEFEYTINYLKELEEIPTSEEDRKLTLGFNKDSNKDSNKDQPE
jgi:SpoVK/Ycf46/Vps4 family AAA+-type ATPase